MNKFLIKFHALLKDNKKKVLFENFLSLSVLQSANYILPLITLPYLVRVLGVEKYGLVMFAQAFIQYFIIFTDYGFNLSATKEIAIHREDENKVTEIFCSVIIIKTLLLFIGFAVLIATISFFPKFRNNYLLYLFTYGIVVGQVFFPVWFFQGMEKMKYITLLNITTKLIFTITILLFVKNKDDYLLVPLLNSMGFIIAGILGLYFVVKQFKVKLIIPKSEQLIEQLKFSFQFFLSRISVSLYTSSNTFVLGLFAGNIAAGYYAAAEQLYKAMQGIFIPLVNALYPFVSKERNLVLYKKIFFVALSFGVIVSGVTFVCSDDITSIIFGIGFEETANLLKLFTVLIIIVAPSMLLGYPFLAAFGYPRYANMSVIVGSLSHIFLLLLIIPLINIYWVVIITIITESIVLMIRVYGIKKYNLWRVK
jgi:PST family polysaccharide transporter